MANYFTRFLTGVAEGVLNPKGQQANWRHATRLFIDNNMRLAPRTKFNYYVRFELNKFAIKAPAFTNKHAEEVGLLVKAADLPKYTFDSAVKNQYNRKKIIYKQINYDPVNLTFHDDAAGVINAMWAIYYGYYIGDRQNPLAAYEANHLRPTKTPKDNFRYGMDNDITEPFFKSVSIYTMSRRRFLGYTLINPRIKSWSHGSMDYAASEFNDNTMSLEYEAVKYSAGQVSYNNPKGFATLHYDSVPSPISVAGGGVATLTGEGGVLDGIEQVFGNLGREGAAFDSVGGFLGTAIGAINTYKNVRQLSSAQLKSEAINILSNPRNISTAISTVGGVVGSVFPKSASTEPVTTGVQRKLTGQ
jgi:hypothetical protein